MGFEATGCSVEAPVEAPGIRPDELARRAWTNSGSPNGEKLARWLVAEGWALERDGLLSASPRLLALGLELLESSAAFR